VSGLLSDAEDEAGERIMVENEDSSKEEEEEDEDEDEEDNTEEKREQLMKLIAFMEIPIYMESCRGRLWRVCEIASRQSIWCRAEESIVSGYKGNVKMLICGPYNLTLISPRLSGGEICRH
jgi:hypothetical protein